MTRGRFYIVPKSCYHATLHHTIVVE